MPFTPSFSLVKLPCIPFARTAVLFFVFSGVLTKKLSCFINLRYMLNFISDYDSMNYGSIPERDRGFLFSTTSGLALGPFQSPIQWVPVVFPRGKIAGAWLWLSSTRIFWRASECAEPCLHTAIHLVAWCVIKDTDNFTFLRYISVIKYRNNMEKSKLRLMNDDNDSN